MTSWAQTGRASGLLRQLRAARWDAVCNESERLCGIQCSLETQLILMPAPDLTALMWKLEHLFGTETRKPEDYRDS